MAPLTYIEPETVVLAQQGNEDASRSIIEDLHQPIMAFAYRMLGPGHRRDLEDIAQEIFLKVFRVLDRFDPSRGVKFTTWVFTFVRNHCLDLMKKRRLPTTSLTSANDEEGQRDPGDTGVVTPLRQAESSEIGDKLAAALEQISPEQREVFVMREQQGLDYGEIANRVGVVEGTVKSRLHRARLALRGHLAELDPSRELDRELDLAPALMAESCCV